MPNPENIAGQGFHTNPERIGEGRPKGSRNRSTIVREILELMEKVRNPITGATEELTQEQIMTLAVLSKGRKGDVRAYQALMDSGYGQAKQNIELDIPLRPIQDVNFIENASLENPENTPAKLNGTGHSS